MVAEALPSKLYGHPESLCNGLGWKSGYQDLAHSGLGAIACGWYSFSKDEWKKKH